jgi:hypothetical protein
MFSSVDQASVLLGFDAATLGILFLTFKRQHNGLTFNSAVKENPFFLKIIFQDQEV